jgi:hypothetical protein
MDQIVKDDNGSEVYEAGEDNSAAPKGARDKKGIYQHCEGIQDSSHGDTAERFAIIRLCKSADMRLGLHGHNINVLTNREKHVPVPRQDVWRSSREVLRIVWSKSNSQALLLRGSF